MTNIRQQMREAVQSGIDGWLDACFTGHNNPTDALTGYPLTRDTARVVYRSQKAYMAIEDEFLEGITPTTQYDTKFFQAWINYHWHYAHLELAENYEHMVMPVVTEEMLERRQILREELIGRGYQLVAS